jgi:hypothetical protein
LVGCEIDKQVLDRTRERFSGSGLELHATDFLRTDAARYGTFDSIVCNPPFTRNTHLTKRERRHLRATFGTTVPAAAGLWAYFLVHSLNLLKPDGRIAFILPGAASFAIYAHKVLDYVSKRFTTLTITPIQEPVAWIGGASEKAVLVLAAGFQSMPLAIESPRGDGPTQDKKHKRTEEEWPPSAAAVQLGSIATFSIGLVTGRNSLFVVNHAIAEQAEIPLNRLRPVVSRAQQLEGLDFRVRDATRLSKQGQRTFLVAPQESDMRQKSFRNYFSEVTAKEVLKVNWFRKRSPWWKVDPGPPCDGVFTYMNSFGPKIVLVDRRIRPTNTLHRVRFKDLSRDSIRTVCVSMLTTYTQLDAEQKGRVYGGGVLKFELRDVRSLSVLMPEGVTVDSAIYRRIDAALRSGARDTARRMADEALLPHCYGENWESIRDQMLARLHELRALRHSLGFQGSASRQRS